MLLAQTADQLTRVCGVGEDLEIDFVCEVLFRLTGNDLVARAGGIVRAGLQLLLILVVAFVVTRLLRGAISRFGATMERRIEARLERGERRGTLDVARYRVRRFQRLHAITGVMRGAAGVLVWVVAVFAVLQTLRIDLRPILAGAGLAGIVIGFGAQQLVRDVLAGIAMLIEDQYGVGDWIEVDGRIGQVERVGLRATSIRDLDGIVWHTLNGHVQQVGNLSQEWSRSLLDVPLALDSDVPAAKAIIHKVASDLAADPIWGEDIIGPPEIWGVQDFGPEGLSIRLVIPTKPMANWDINRQLRERLHRAFGQANIRMQGRLVEVGGMASGYPLLSRAPSGEGAQQQRPRRRGLVPTDVGPLDQPPKRPAGDPADVDTGEFGRDQTTELRLERGREPRPD
ncbi:mechanosensitive ion channel family protein [Egicoccus sp. AB-alg6-2]|uniref:mechanosensitive ion channel family protein n=1 Tax=Egicoccus sp. AB-alg6-2 TaxID=3242692 RepID=UPI00359D7CCE